MSDNISHRIHKALKVRIYPSEKQRVILNKTFGCCRVGIEATYYNSMLSGVSFEVENARSSLA